MKVLVNPFSLEMKILLLHFTSIFLKFIKSFLSNLTLLFLLFFAFAKGQNATNFQNPILQGFNPDPSICRVNNDYYLVTSSFTCYPGIPVYHSKDLVNWELIGYGINRAGQLNFSGLKDKNGVWAVTIRYHKGIFYLVSTCSECGGNFYITAEDPAGPWSDPVWLKDAPGIDGSLFWDENDRCYYTGNNWEITKSWPGQCAIWGQELDLKQGKLVGERKILTYGHANNAVATEAPHIFKIGNDYLLLTAEGGTDQYHAITVHHSSSVMGNYISDKINPVLTHRHLGQSYPIQAVGHGDLVQTQNGEWWSVVLGKRLVDGEVPLGRETFLCKVTFQNRTPIFNPGYGKVLTEQERPNLPWSPVKPEPARDGFDSAQLSLKWYTIRIPEENFYNITNSKLTLAIRSYTADSLVNSSMLLQRIRNHHFSATTKLTFKTAKDNEQAGIILYRTSESYYLLAKEKSRIVLIKKSDGKKEIIAEAAYTLPDVYLNVKAQNLNLEFSFGESPDKMFKIGENPSLVPLCENQVNRFNGPGLGIYATGNGKSSRSKAIFDWFEKYSLN